MIRAAAGARVVVDGLAVKNAGWEWVALEEAYADAGAAPEEERIRGFTVRKAEAREVTYDAPGLYTLQ